MQASRCRRSSSSTSSTPRGADARQPGCITRCAHGSRKTAVMVAATAALLPTGSDAIPVPQGVSRMRLKTRSDCQLGVSVYPIFAYNAVGGGGWASVQDLGQGLLKVIFDAQALVIPDLSWRTATLFNIPIPPPLNIAITPLRLEGVVNTVTGEMNLEFDANFVFTASTLYQAPPLVVRTLLTTESSQGRFRQGTGERVQGNRGRLAGTATVEKTGDVLMDTFLMLPTDALAIMSAELEFE